MQFFLYEIVARIVAIYLCVDWSRKLWVGLVERKIAYFSGVLLKSIQSIGDCPIIKGFSQEQKSAAGSGGRAGRARTRSGDGEGWDVTGDA